MKHTKHTQTWVKHSKHTSNSNTPNISNTHQTHPACLKLTSNTCQKVMTVEVSKLRQTNQLDSPVQIVQNTFLAKNRTLPHISIHTKHTRHASNLHQIHVKKWWLSRSQSFARLIDWTLWFKLSKHIFGEKSNSPSTALGPQVRRGAIYA